MSVELNARTSVLIAIAHVRRGALCTSMPAGAPIAEWLWWLSRWSAGCWRHPEDHLDKVADGPQRQDSVELVHKSTSGSLSAIGQDPGGVHRLRAFRSGWTGRPSFFKPPPRLRFLLFMNRFLAHRLGHTKTFQGLCGRPSAANGAACSAPRSACARTYKNTKPNIGFLMY